MRLFYTKKISTKQTMSLNKLSWFIPMLTSVLFSAQPTHAKLYADISKDVRKTTGLVRAAMDLPTRTYVLNVGNWHFLGEPMLVRLEQPVSTEWDYYILSTQFNIPAMRHLPFGLNSLSSYRFARFEEFMDVTDKDGKHDGAVQPRRDSGVVTKVRDLFFGDDQLKLEKNPASPNELFASKDDLHQNFSAARRQLNSLAKNFRNEEEKNVKILSIYPTSVYLSPNFDDTQTLDIQAKPEYSGFAGGSVDWKHTQEWKYIYNLPTVSGIATRSGSASWTYYPAKKQQIMFGNKTTYVLFAVRKLEKASSLAISSSDVITTPTSPLPSPMVTTQPSQPAHTVTTTISEYHEKNTSYTSNGKPELRKIDKVTKNRTFTPVAPAAKASEPKELEPSVTKIAINSIGAQTRTIKRVTIDPSTKAVTTHTEVISQPSTSADPRYLRLNCLLNYELLLTAPFCSARVYDEALLPLSSAIEGPADLLALRSADYNGDAITSIIRGAFGKSEPSQYQLQSAGQRAFLINTKGLKEIKADDSLKDVSSPGGAD
ncbi:MAG: hypothetical protein JST89_13400 [Cyanobacteria bacterium SZAS-4]|nr:hypothetical protein [Cyanobacteria bacterium SZAS-4]